MQHDMTVPFLKVILLPAAMVAVDPMAQWQQARLIDQEAAKDNGMLKVEIWSDIVCPFCYIGKKEFEAALAQVPFRDSVEVVWRSFELDPRAPQQSPFDMYGMLVDRYGGTRESAKARVEGVVRRGHTVGITFNMDDAVIGSSFDAHRLLQLAKTKGLGNEAKERLFKAYFTDGAHIADHATLVRTGREMGLDPKEVQRMLSSTEHSEAVRADERAAHLAGVRGVPFFLMDGVVKVSGAQESAAFKEALEQAWARRKGR